MNNNKHDDIHAKGLECFTHCEDQKLEECVEVVAQLGIMAWIGTLLEVPECLCILASSQQHPTVHKKRAFFIFCEYYGTPRVMGFQRLLATKYFHPQS